MSEATTPAASAANENDDKHEIVHFINNQSGNTTIIDGPLSRAYGDALNELYGKRKDPVTGLAMETQAIDALHSQMEYIEKQAGKIFLDNEEQNLSLLYGVEKGKADAEDLIELTDTLSTMTPLQKSNSAVIFDAAIRNGNTGEIPKVETSVQNPFENALEQLCVKHDVKIYASFAAYINQHH